MFLWALENEGNLKSSQKHCSVVSSEYVFDGVPPKILSFIKFTLAGTFNICMSASTREVLLISRVRSFPRVQVQERSPLKVPGLA